MFSCFSCVQLFVSLWTVSRQAPLSIRFSGQEYWSGWPCPPSGDLPDPGTDSVFPVSPTLLADSLPLSHWVAMCVCVSRSVVPKSVTPWTAVHQASLSMGFSRQEYWSGLPFPSPLCSHQFSSVHSLSHVRLFVTWWTVAHQTSLSMGFSTQEY